MRNTIRLGCVLVATCASASGQTILTRFLPPHGENGYWICASAGDVNGDGYADILVGGPNDWMHEGAQVYSGANYSVLFDLAPASLASSFGSGVAGLGDVNGDGKGEFVVAADDEAFTSSTQGILRVYSGANATVLHALPGRLQAERLGYSVAALADVDGDSFRDFIAGLPESGYVASHGGGAAVYSGATGAKLYQVFGSGVKDTLGLSVGDAGDVNHDGRSDFIVGAPQLTTAPPTAGYAVVYSGMTGAILYTLVGDSPRDGFGTDVSGVGDLNGDGYADFAVAAPGDDNNGADSGSLRVFSGATGLALYTVSGAHAGDGFGAVAGGIDLDLDGNLDLMVGAPGEASGAGRVHILRGYDGLQTAVWSVPSSTAFGGRIRIAGDTNADGYVDVLVSAASGDGETILISGFDCPIHNYCVTSPNSVGGGAVLSATGSRSVTQNAFKLIATGVQNNTPGLFYYGPSMGSTPFGNGVRCISGPTFRLPIVFAQGGALTHLVDFTSPQSPAATITGGSRWMFQAWYRDSLGPSFFNLSDGLDVTFCP